MFVLKHDDCMDHSTNYRNFMEKYPNVEEKIKNLEILISKTDSKLRALEKDRDNALKWGIMVLGTVVISMGSYISKLLTDTPS